MLASLERARDNERRFLADASHELRTPLTALRGNVAYLARHGATPELVAESSGPMPRGSRDWPTTCWRSHGGVRWRANRGDQARRAPPAPLRGRASRPTPSSPWPSRGDRAAPRAGLELVRNAELSTGRGRSDHGRCGTTERRCPPDRRRRGHRRSRRRRRSRRSQRFWRGAGGKPRRSRASGARGIDRGRPPRRHRRPAPQARSGIALSRIELPALARSEISQSPEHKTQSTVRERIALKHLRTLDFSPSFC